MPVDLVEGKLSIHDPANDWPRIARGILDGCGFVYTREVRRVPEQSKVRRILSKYEIGRLL
jgi:hypothetical protein